jgi:3-oxoacyl-[acyl-carrier-protein] synthase-3
MKIRIASAAYALPPEIVDVEAVMLEEKSRIEAALEPLSERLRERALKGLGMECVRVCGRMQPYELAKEAASKALAEAGLCAGELDLIIDFVTLPGKDGQYLSFAQKLSCDLGAETSLNLSYRVGGCGGLHLALKNALALMETDESLETALLVTADSPPKGSRSLLPITIQGDAGSAVVLAKGDGTGPTVLGTEVLTLGHLYDTITVARGGDGLDSLAINVDSARIESELMPLYYLNFFRLLDKILARFELTPSDIDYFIYSNISRTDREGFVKALGLSEKKVISTGMAELGHTFASDLIVNYANLRQEQPLETGQYLIFASAGIGFTWGVTLAKA